MIRVWANVTIQDRRETWSWHSQHRRFRVWVRLLWVSLSNCWIDPFTSRRWPSWGRRYWRACPGAESTKVQVSFWRINYHSSHELPMTWRFLILRQVELQMLVVSLQPLHWVLVWVLFQSLLGLVLITNERALIWVCRVYKVWYNIGLTGIRYTLHVHSWKVWVLLHLEYSDFQFF